MILGDSLRDLPLGKFAEKIKNPYRYQIPPHGRGGTSPRLADRRSASPRARGEPREGCAVIPLVKMMWRNNPYTRRQEVCECRARGEPREGCAVIPLVRKESLLVGISYRLSEYLLKTGGNTYKRKQATGRRDSC